MALLNSILADSTGGSDLAMQQMAGNAVVNADSPRVNIVESANIISGTFNNSGVIAADPNLGPLANYGGPTLSMLPGAGPARNSGNNADAAGLNFDQRGPGFPRNADGAVDLGAVEVKSTLATSLANNQDFTIIGATGSPTSILSVKIFDGSGNLVGSVQPFNNLTSLRVAAGDFDGDGVVDGFAVLGRRTGIDLRAEIVTYDLDASGNATETGRFFAFAPGILGNGFIAAGDFDGDGDDDLAVAQIGGGLPVVTLQVHTNNGDGSFSMGGSTTIDFGVISAPRIGAGDTDGDGFAEIVVAARTPAGARVLIFDADTLTPLQQGAGFTWTFGIDGYARGAFVAVSEFDPTFTGEEIVLGSNVGGGGLVDIVNYDGVDTATLSEIGRLTPFGAGYTAAVRVAAGQLNDRNVLVVGQDRFQDGQFAILAREVNTVEPNAFPRRTLAGGEPARTHHGCFVVASGNAHAENAPYEIRCFRPAWLDVLRPCARRGADRTAQHRAHRRRR